jgi:hypothetical protein
VIAIDEAQRLGTQITHSDEMAHIEEVALGLTAVVDAFQMYASMLERFRSGDEATVGQSAQSRPLAAVADDERVLLNCRALLRRSMQQLTSALAADR